jgi:hypothetical protein
MQGLLRTVDRNWPLGIFVVAALGSVLGSLFSTDCWTKAHLIGRLDPSTRGILYGSLATSAGALLGLTIASIAILLTLDGARPAVAEMQALDAWRILNATLLAAAGFLALDLLVSTVALGLDSGAAGRSGIETAVFAVSIIAFCELVVGGIAFAIVVLNLTHREGR